MCVSPTRAAKFTKRHSQTLTKLHGGGARVGAQAAIPHFWNCRLEQLGSDATGSEQDDPSSHWDGVAVKCVCVNMCHEHAPPPRRLGTYSDPSSVFPSCAARCRTRLLGWRTNAWMADRVRRCCTMASSPVLLWARTTYSLATIRTCVGIQQP